MFRTIGFALMAFALFTISGGHWALLQGVAWTGMVIQYAKEGSFAQALEKTFDGEHPCSLCHKVQEAKKDEGQKAPMLGADKKLEPFSLVILSEVASPPSTPFSYPPLVNSLFTVRGAEPPQPVPRSSVS
jgi:hypothetical protein